MRPKRLAEPAGELWEGVAVGAHFALAALALVVALLLLILAVVPGLVSIMPLALLVLVPVAGVAVVVALVGTVGAWRNRAVLAAGVALGLSVAGGCFILVGPDTTSSWAKAISGWVAVSATMSAALAVHSTLLARRLVVVAYAAVMLAAWIVVADPFDSDADERRLPDAGVEIGM